jgi:hypothetical protein
MFLNKRHAKRREELGKSADRVDESMIGKAAIQSGKAVDMEESNVEGNKIGAAEAAEHAGSGNDRAFLDLTDLENEDFIYVY